MATINHHKRRHHGLPNLFRPLNIAAGEFLNGVPLAVVATPPGSAYVPGPGEGSLKSFLCELAPFRYPVPNLIDPDVSFLESTCGSHAETLAPLYSPGPTVEPPCIAIPSLYVFHIDDDNKYGVIE